MPNVMLDLETMGLGYNAAIVAIGAVIFDPETECIGEQFYKHVSLKSSIDSGADVDASTIMWWLDQTEAARYKLLNRADEVALGDALIAFSSWLPPDSRVWGNGAAFDNVILRQSYRRLGLRPPWEYSDDRCYRTLKAALPEVCVPKEEPEHDALADARYQAKVLMAAYSQQQPLEVS